jgi:hypothetical protein
VVSVTGSWFTFDSGSPGGLDKQRWYTFSAPVTDTTSTATFSLQTSVGGNFNAGPIVHSAPIGDGTLQLADCTHATLTYELSDGTGRTGSIPLTRLTSNITCGIDGNNGSPAGSYLLSGAWYDPNTSGQGLLFDVNPLQSIFAAAWYTFAPNGSATGGAASQRWYTLQAALVPGSSTISNIPIYITFGGVFNTNAPVTQTQVGTATVAFSSCTAATLSYTFNATGSDNAGLSGTINLVRLGPAPTGCTL